MVRLSNNDKHALCSSNASIVAARPSEQPPVDYRGGYRLCCYLVTLLPPHVYQVSHHQRADAINEKSPSRRVDAEKSRREVMREGTELAWRKESKGAHSHWSGIGPRAYQWRHVFR